MTRMFGHSIRSELLALCIVEALATFLAVYLIISSVLPESASGSGRALAFAAIIAACAELVAGASGLYETATWSRRRSLVLRIAVAAALLLLLAALMRALLAPAGAAEAAWRDLALVLFAWLAAGVTTRLVFAAMHRRGLLRQRIALVSGAEAALRTAPSGADAGFEVALSPPADAVLSEALAPERLRAKQVSAVVAPNPALLPPSVLCGCRASGVGVLSALEFQERRLSRVAIDALPEDWLVTAQVTRETRSEAALRRGFDIVLSLALLLLTLPLLLLAALAIKLDSPGPVFYRQERVGRGGDVFRLLKFRSMVFNAEAAGQPVWACSRDPRVTQVGRMLRLLRIDEIPQVINVLRGDMAFIGPRPERPGFVAELGRLIPHYHDRACIKPGITGWAQVNYPYGASIEDAREKLAYDLYYARHRSLLLDLLILIATVRVVLFQEGSR